MAASGAMLARSFASTTEIKEYLRGRVRDALESCSTHMKMVISEHNVFEVYLSTRMSSSSTNKINIFKHFYEGFNVTPALLRDEVFTDTFEGVKLSWILRDNTHSDLSFPKKAKELVTATYLPFVSQVAASTRLNTLTLFTVYQSDKWRHGTFNHPSTFDTMALDPQVKRSLIDDLDQFLESGDKNVGKAWFKRYLLYGPTGTGKSCLIAAMANYLKADVYELDLNGVSNTSQLRKLLMETANRSILALEYIDCLRKIKIADVDETKATLSSLLDFMDQGWSNCGHQRIIVFTASNREKVDPASRVDVEIHMSYCTPSAFEFLASNYLNISSHELFKEIKELIVEVEASPAEVAEQLLTQNLWTKSLKSWLSF